jgi:hypothetical protein
VVYALLIGSIAVRRSVPLRRLLKQIFAKVSDPLSGTLAVPNEVVAEGEEGLRDRP